MPASVLMIASTFLFAAMGACVKLASLQYSAGEIVFYRSAFSTAYMLGWMALNKGTPRTAVPSAHVSRSLTGVGALALWFWSIGGLPIATATTLNYMSSVWLAVAAVGASLFLRGPRVDARMVLAVLLGFAGVLLVLQPTVAHNQWLHGLAALASGVLAAWAYVQVKGLGRLGEPEYRIVFYFSLGGLVVGAVMMAFGGQGTHTLQGVLLLLAIGLLATVAQLMFTRAYAVGRMLRMAALQYTGILFSFVLGMAVFQDRLSMMAMLGMACIVAAGLAATFLNAKPAKDASS